MIDIHTHILPNVDDGSESVEISLEMLKIAVENGVKDIILTPHLFYNINKEPDIPSFIDAFDKLKEASSNIPINLYLGSEIYYNPSSIKALQEGKILTLNNTKYILVEFNLVQELYNIQDALYNLKVKGFLPILAHPERYPYLSIKDIASCKDEGAIIQVNTSSILGHFGKDVQKKVIKMIKLGLVDAIASDCHSTGIRKPNLKEAIDYLKDKYKISWENSKIIDEILK